jgi:hypothetical protein
VIRSVCLYVRGRKRARQTARIHTHLHTYTHTAFEFPVCGSGGHLLQISISASSLICQVLSATDITRSHVCRNLISGK